MGRPLAPGLDVLDRTIGVGGDVAELCLAYMPQVDEVTNIERIDAYRTTDGRIHTVCSVAEEWQGKLDGAVISNRLLNAGSSLGDALRFGGLLDALGSARMPELDEITRDTRLIISHWQCRDTPGYQPISITAGGNVFVHGDAGSWSGPYGNICAPHEVARYWVDTKKRTAK